MMVEISQLKVNEIGAGTKRFSALVGGREVWIEAPGALAPAPRGEMFLAIGLFLAMARREDLVVDPALPLCPELSARLPHIIAIIRQWNPELGAPRIEARQEPVAAQPGLVFTSFSGGVDSTYTFHRHRDSITHLLVTNCFDEAGATEPFEALVKKVAAFADEHAKAVLPIATNARRVCEAQGMSWDYLHGPFLCLTAAAFGPAQYFIPSSFSVRQLKPWGSHPLLDPMWSTATTRIVHDGIEVPRTEKIRALSRDPALLRYLQVCWYSKINNCGTCTKCTRTLLVLRELGVTDAPFPDVDPTARIDAMRPDSDIAAAYIWDLWRFFEDRGRADIAARLRKRLDRYLLKRNMNNLVKTVIGRRGKAVFHGLRKTGWRDKSVLIRDPDNFE